MIKFLLLVLVRERRLWTTDDSIDDSDLRVGLASFSHETIRCPPKGYKIANYLKLRRVSPQREGEKITARCTPGNVKVALWVPSVRTSQSGLPEKSGAVGTRHTTKG